MKKLQLSFFAMIAMICLTANINIFSVTLNDIREQKEAEVNACQAQATDLLKAINLNLEHVQSRNMRLQQAEEFLSLVIPQLRPKNGELTLSEKVKFISNQVERFESLSQECKYLARQIPEKEDDKEND